MFDNVATGIVPQITPQVAVGGTPPADSGTGLPQYSWGFDPSTNSWGYFMNKAGSQSAQIGRKAGDKLRSYTAPANDAAALQQQALQHLLDTQQVAAADPNTVKPTNVVGSGIAAAVGNPSGHGGGGAGIGLEGGASPDNGTYGTDSGLSGFAAGLGNLGQALGGTTLGKVLGWASDKLASVNNPNYGNEGRNVPVPPGPDESAAETARLTAAAEAAGSPSDTSAATQNQTDANQSAAETGRLAAANTPAAPSGGGSGGDASGGGGDASGGGGAATGGNGGDASGGGDRGTRGGFAAGGPVAGLHAAASLPPRFVRGPGDGQSDNIPVKMSDGGMGRLADNEFVIPADAVSALGSGSSEAGARALYEMVDRIRQTAHGTKTQAKPVDPAKVMPV